MTPVVAPATAACGHARRRRLLPPAVTIAGLGAATLALALRDPHVQGAWGLCPSQAVGIDCPGCGCLRAVNDLTHLRVADALSSNLFFVVLVVPVVVFLLGRWVVDAWRGTDRPASPSTTPLLVAAGVALVVFTILRNLPGLEWLAS